MNYVCIFLYGCGLRLLFKLLIIRNIPQKTKRLCFVVHTTTVMVHAVCGYEIFCVEYDVVGA